MDLNLFHAYVFLDEIDKAEKIYTKNLSRTYHQESWEKIVKEDIVLLKNNNMEIRNFYKILEEGEEL